MILFPVFLLFLLPLLLFSISFNNANSYTDHPEEEYCIVNSERVHAYFDYYYSFKIAYNLKRF